MMERQREIDVLAVIHGGGSGRRIEFWHILENREVVGFRREG